MVVSVLRRRRIGWMITSGLGALVLVAGLVFLLAATNAPQPTILVASSSSTFRIEGEVRQMPTGSGAAPRCGGPAAVLVPGVGRCMVYQVHNSLDRTIEVQTITMGLDPDFPPPPSGCSAAKLRLPSFSGVLQVPAKGNIEAPGLPIQLRNTETNQDDCRQKMLHFTFAGTATYTDPGSTGPEQGLPDTGVAVGGLVLGAGILITAGCILRALARRRRAEASS